MEGADWKLVRLFLWVVPRTVSTALTKCLSAIDGMKVWFECFTTCSTARKQYQLVTGENLPMEYKGNEEKARHAADILQPLLGGGTVKPDQLMYGNVKRKIESSASKCVLVKEGYFAFPDEKSRDYLPAGFKHVFLIRDPYKVLTSYKKAMTIHVLKTGLLTSESAKTFNLEKDDPVLNAGEFFRGIHDIWKYIRGNVDPNAVVINTDDLLAKPAEVLKKFCHLTGLPYSDSLLQWEASLDFKASKDGFDTFYETANSSSGFLPPKPTPCWDSLAPDVIKLADASMPYFEEINKHKI
nr:uncharacterized protein LOC129279274 [Lytechinus pictus]